MVELPKVLTPSEFASHFGWSERLVRQTAKKLGACHIVGNRMILTEQDVSALLEDARPCPSNYSDPKKVDRGTTGEPLTGQDYADLVALRTKQKHRAKPHRSKRISGNVVSMAQARR